MINGKVTLYEDVDGPGFGYKTEQKRKQELLKENSFYQKLDLATSDHNWISMAKEGYVNQQFLKYDNCKKVIHADISLVKIAELSEYNEEQIKDEKQIKFLETQLDNMYFELINYQKCEIEKSLNNLSLLKQNIEEEEFSKLKENLCEIKIY